MTDEKNRLKTACAVLAALLVCMIALNIANSEALTYANGRINAVYQKAFYESCTQTRGISANYRKLLVAGDDGQMQTLLGEISRQCQAASSSLALLPLDQQTIAATLKFINQAEDFAETLSLKIGAGDGVSRSDYDAMLALSDAAAQLSDAMLALLERFESGETAFPDGDLAETGDRSLLPLTSSPSDYPTLLYDGPFSDGDTAGHYEMLAAEPEISPEQAESALRAFIPVDEIRYLGQSNPGVACYDFSLRSGSYNLSAAVTQTGGYALYLLPESVSPVENLPADELCMLAEDFLRARGYGDVAMRYYCAHDGVLTVNFAAVQDEVILYPDLIKVQLSMDDGAVIGFDARSYLKNHRSRHISHPAIDENAAMAAAGDRIDAESARLCIIPQNRQEFLCYEVAATDGGDRFLIYIDAQTGGRRDLKQLLPTDNGTLVM